MPNYPFDQASTITVQVDWTGDETYSHTYSNVTAYVLDFHSQQGANAQFQNVASIGTCEITLNNASGIFDPLRTTPSIGAALMVPGVKVRISFNHPTGTYNYAGKYFTSLTDDVVFCGEITAYVADVTDKGDRLLKLTCQDYLGRLNDTAIKMPPLHKIMPHTAESIAVDTAFQQTVATGWIWFKANPSNNDYFTLLFGFEQTNLYTFKTTLSGASNEVLLGATLAATLANAANALNGGVGRGTSYANTLQKSIYLTAAASANNHSLDFTATFRGGEGNKILVGTSSSNAIVSKSYFGQVAHQADYFYDMSEPSGTTMIEQVTGANGSYSGAVTLAQTSPLTGISSVLFNASTTSTTGIPTSFFNTSTYSYDIWFKPTASTTDSFIIHFYYSAGAADRGSVIFRLVNPHLEIKQGGTIFSTANNSITVGSWNYISAVYASGTLTIYINGLFAASQAVSTMNTCNVFLGSSNDSLFPVKGYVTAFRAYSGILSVTTMQDLYNNRQTNSISSGFTEGGTFTKTNSSIFYYTTNTNSIFEYVGDSWNENETTCLKAIEDLTKAEMGRFWQARSGQLFFMSINDLLTSYDGLAFTGGSAPARFSYRDAVFQLSEKRDEIFNSISVNYVPRVTSASIGVLGQAKNIITVPGQSGSERWNGTVVIPGGGSTTFSVDFINPLTGNKCGASAIIPPIAGTDWNANEQSNLTGIDYTNYTPNPLIFSIVLNGTGAEVSIKNTALGPLYVYNFQIRGYAIPMESSTVEYSEDATSITKYGKRKFSYDINVDVKPAFARALSTWFLSSFKDPLFRVSDTIDFGNRTLIGSFVDDQQTILGGASFSPRHILDVNIMDFVTLYQPRMASELRFLVVGIGYTWTPRSLQTSITLERLPAVTNTAGTNGYFIVDNASFGKLDLNYLGV